MAVGWTAAVGPRCFTCFSDLGRVYYFDMSLMRLRGVFDRMPRVLWREREIPEEIVTIVQEDHRVRSLLGIFGLLKFAEVLMMQSAGLLLNRLIDF